MFFFSHSIIVGQFWTKCFVSPSFKREANYKQLARCYKLQFIGCATVCRALRGKPHRKNKKECKIVFAWGPMCWKNLCCFWQLMFGASDRLCSDQLLIRINNRKVFVVVLYSKILQPDRYFHRLVVFARNSFTVRTNRVSPHFWTNLIFNQTIKSKI